MERLVNMETEEIKKLYTNMFAAMLGSENTETKKAFMGTLIDSLIACVIVDTCEAIESEILNGPRRQLRRGHDDIFLEPNPDGEYIKVKKVTKIINAIKG